MENTGASGSAAGSFVVLYSNDGAAMASGDRLGGYMMGGSSSASAIRIAASISAYTQEAWVDATAYGTYLRFDTTTLGATARSEKMRISAGGNVGIGITAVGTNSLKVLGIGTGTEPADHVDDSIQIFSKDASTGGATLGLFTEAAVEAIGTFTASHKFKLWYNGVEYWIQLDAVAP
jgi:hypothetical protein